MNSGALNFLLYPSWVSLSESRIGALLCQNQQEIFTSNYNISGSWIVE